MIFTTPDPMRYQNPPPAVCDQRQPVMDDRTLPRWVAELPNYGRQSHTPLPRRDGDYGLHHVFQREGRTLGVGQ